MIVISFSAAIGLITVYGLTLRWDQSLHLVNWSPFKFHSDRLLEAVELYNPCVALSLLPSFFLVSLGCFVSKKFEIRSLKVMTILGITFALLGWFYGASPIWKKDQCNQIYKLQSQRRLDIYFDLERLRKEGEYEEIVQILEESLEIQRTLNNIRGVVPRGHAHGFSYLYVTLYPAADDLPSYLGMNATEFLFDAWHDPSMNHPSIYEKDELAIALSHSKDRLLRAIAYWVLQDYVNFEKEAIAGALAEDQRMDSLALIAACLFSTDKKAALKAVEPILDRDVGIGWKAQAHYTSSHQIRRVLEGKASIDTLNGYYRYPPTKHVP